MVDLHGKWLAPFLLLMSGAACGGSGGSSSGAATPGAAPTAEPPAAAISADCRPLETRQPNAAGQQPAFPGQTRACEADSGVAFDVQVLAGGLERPWAVEPLPDGSGFLVTERPGRMRFVSAAGAVGEPIAGLPAVAARGQGGLLDVALGPSFGSDRIVYWSYAEPRQGGNGTAVARGVLSGDRSRLEQVQVIFRAQPTFDGTAHFGSRLAFDADGMLYVTTGDRSVASMREHAQRLDSHMGKVLRMRRDGSVPPDNPFVGQAGALPEIWSLGHRNTQAGAFDAQGRLWIVEHGTQGGDELNLVAAGKNYGWPLVAFGEEYSGAPLPAGATTREGFVDPVYFWDPVIAPSGAQFYGGEAFAGRRGSLFVGALKERRLVRLVIDGERVVGEEHLLGDRGKRVRDVREGADGALYVVTDETQGELWRIAPAR